MESSPGSSGSAIYLPSVPQSHHHCLQITGGEAAPAGSGFLWWHCPLGMFPLFLKRTAEVLATRLAEVFRRLLRLYSFRVCWRVTNVTPIPKGPPSSSASNYRPISLTPILSKVFERLVSFGLGPFMECRGVLPTTQFA